MFNLDENNKVIMKHPDDIITETDITKWNPQFLKALYYSRKYYYMFKFINFDGSEYGGFDVDKTTSKLYFYNPTLKIFRPLKRKEILELIDFMKKINSKKEREDLMYNSVEALIKKRCFFESGVECTDCCENCILEALSLYVDRKRKEIKEREVWD